MARAPLSALPVKARLDAARPHFADLPAGRLEYADVGGGPPLLALHGALGGFDQALLLAMAAFGDWPARRILAPSRPGYLGTRLETGRSPEEQADLYAALLDYLGIDAVDVVAVSGGGPSAILFAARHPARCRSLVLISACMERLVIPQEYQGRFETMLRITRHAPVRWLMALTGRFAPEGAIRRSIADEALCRRTLADPEAGPLIRALQFTVMSRLTLRMPGLVNDTACCAALEDLPLESVQAPALVIHGTGDRAVPFAHAADAMKRLPQARLLAIEGGEHVCLFTHIERVRAAIARISGEG